MIRHLIFVVILFVPIIGIAASAPALNSESAFEAYQSSIAKLSDVADSIDGSAEDIQSMLKGKLSEKRVKGAIEEVKKIATHLRFLQFDLEQYRPKIKRWADEIYQSHDAAIAWVSQKLPGQSKYEEGFDWDVSVQVADFIDDEVFPQARQAINQVEDSLQEFLKASSEAYQSSSTSD